MDREVNEALLEMYFFRAVERFISEEYGARRWRMLKPSTQDETWVGFDQGLVATEVSTKQLFEELKESIQNEDTESPNLYIGVFLQFKVVERMLKSSVYKPVGYTTPYYRSELSLEVSERTNLSQHETLRRLAFINGAEVFYACGMLFNVDRIFVEPNIDDLRLVPIGDAPDGWDASDRHFITFQEQHDPNPMWCSKPEEGRAYSCKQWLKHHASILSAKEVITLLREIEETMMNLKRETQSEMMKLRSETVSELKSDRGNIRNRNGIPLSFVIIEFAKD